MTAHLSDATRLLIDFNVHAVASALGLAIPDAAAALMYGVESAALTDYQAAIDAELAHTVQPLHAHAGVTALRALLSPGQRVLCIGDSITAYRRGYAHLLRHLLAPHGVEVVNRGYSGYTSTHGVELTYTQFLSVQPDLVLIKYGVNDCKQFDGALGQTLVSLGEYAHNLARIIGAFQRHTRARVLVLTPTPVIEPLVNAHPDISAMRLTWSNAVLRQYAQVALSIADRAQVIGVDAFQLFDAQPDAALYCPDGLHPNADGHARLVAHLLDRLSSHYSQG